MNDPYEGHTDSICAQPWSAPHSYAASESLRRNTDSALTAFPVDVLMASAREFCLTMAETSGPKLQAIRQKQRSGEELDVVLPTTEPKMLLREELVLVLVEKSDFSIDNEMLLATW